MSTEEQFDIYNPEGEWIGTAPRSEVHASGYWHKSFHCWLVRDTNDDRMVLFQKRVSSKDTFPSCFDITAAGHLSAGETLEDASRELEEELGLVVSYSQLTPLLEVKEELHGEVHGVPFLDREISNVFGLNSSLPLHEYRLQHSEVQGLYEAPLSEMLDLFQGKVKEVQTIGIQSLGEGKASELFAETIKAEQFVSRPFSYYVSIFEKLKEL
ncbi:NUDIX domain-containing protein [Paenibacillus sp. Marseille-Q4541]|uniref:NUDIX hydrolase n=1 Tax=Paenibacillus sp. Marseille-Q4541 TaxID=2831522 RepID=UPI001BA52FE4|nr:NUDIX domain-containing protein [Paenibacillus sp. Marseille-Q4541]